MMTQGKPLPVNFFVTPAAKINAFKTAGLSFFGFNDLVDRISAIGLNDQGPARHQLLYFIFTNIECGSDGRPFTGGNNYFIIDIIVRRTDAMSVSHHKPIAISQDTAEMKAAVK